MTVCVQKNVRVQSKPLRRRAGSTPAITIPELSTFFGLTNLLVKDESVNPFGTHKDRKSEYIVHLACTGKLGPKPDAFSVITSGNAGLSLGAFAARKNIPVVAVVDALPNATLAQLRRCCQDVLQVDLTERIWTTGMLRSLMQAHGYKRPFDASNCAMAYTGLGLELAALDPEVIVLPVGSGELFVALARVIKDLHLRTRLYGATVARRDSIADKLVAFWTPYRSELNALTLRSTTGHQLVEIDDEAGLRDTYRFVRKHVRCEPSSALAFHLLCNSDLKASSRVVVLNTGTARNSGA